MIPLTNPPLAEVIRADTTNVNTAIASLLEFYNPPFDGKFNYLRAVKTVMRAYKGLHRLDLLGASLPSLQKRPGFKANQDVISLACPEAFGRSTQVFDLKGRKFSFGRERYATYRIPFFFVENQIVKIYFLQYRKAYNLTHDDFAGIYTVHKRFILDQEFFDYPVDVEYVDCAAEEEKGPRVLRKYDSSKFELWSDDRLNDHLSVVASAMDEIEKREIKVKRIRPLRDTELPLFD